MSSIAECPKCGHTLPGCFDFDKVDVYRCSNCDALFENGVFICYGAIEAAPPPTKRKTSNELPEEATVLMEQFVRDISKIGCAVFGVVYRVEPAPGIALMRNTSGNPVHTLDVLRDIIQQACDDNRIEDRQVLPEN